MIDYSIIQKIIYQISDSLADYLSKHLPKLGDDWWYTRVVPILPPFLKDTAQKDNLHSLDTAALLKIFDKNWEELRNVVRLDYSLRNYVKEAQTIRNTWAHPPADGKITDDIVDRHLDTLRRLCEGIDADETLIDKITQAKIDINNKIYGVPLSVPQPVINTSNTPETTGSINVGTLIRLISKPDQMAAVIKLSTAGKEPRYTVFINGKQQNWYQSQIEVVDSTDDELTTIPLDEFNAYLTTTQLNNPNSSALFSLNSAKIDIIPHQFRPVLKFIKSDRPRLLIADGVGVGKTIEAGLILKEIEARNDIESVLIICPKPLVSERKWEEEMKYKFGETFHALDSAAFRQAIKEASRDEWDMSKYGKIIVPYSLLTEDKLWEYNRNPGLFELENPPKFDLVIVDEAHHIRHSDTMAYRAVKYFIDNADAALLLTATPIQMGMEDLFVLLNLIRPDIVPDPNTFNQMAAPNPEINAAIEEIRSQRKDWMKRAKTHLEEAAKTYWGQVTYPINPIYKNSIELLSKEFLTDEERVSLLSDVESLHSFSFIINRTRRRDIDSGYASRKPITIETPFTKEQMEVYKEVLRIQEDIFKIIQPDTPAAFMMNTLQRRAASCLPGLIPFLENILKRNLIAEDYLEADVYEMLDIDVAELRADIEKLIKKAKNLPPRDDKYEQLRKILNEKKLLTPNKAMLFSTFRHTLNYLSDKLILDGFRVGMIHGDVNDEDRIFLRDRFKLPPDDPDAIDVLLFSEVGCEGLDYQFCDCMINYDLPWNPMKIEQRIGRIDRTGQKSETITIFNMITPDTVDAEIYLRCTYRIGVFEDAIGGNEEILGKITEEITSIGENFSLSPEERKKRLSQLADNEIRKYLEREKLAEEQAELFGVSLPSMQLNKDIEDATSFWLSPVSLENLIKIYFKKRFKSDGEFVVGTGKSKKLRLSAENRSILKNDFNMLRPRAEYSRWKRWLDGKDKEKSPYYQIYFDSKLAVDGAGDLITPTHPLVRQAIANISWKDTVATSITVTDAEMPEGEYPFAVYLWDYSGVLKNQKIMPIAEDSTISEKIFSYLKDGVFTESTVTISEDEKEKLDAVQYELWNEERTNHQKKNKETIRYKVETLKHSYHVRKEAIKRAIDTAKNEHIIRMKRDELKNVEADEKIRIDAILETESTADVETSLVGYGIVRISHE